MDKVRVFTDDELREHAQAYRQKYGKWPDANLLRWYVRKETKKGAGSTTRLQSIIRELKNRQLVNH